MILVVDYCLYSINPFSNTSSIPFASCTLSDYTQLLPCSDILCKQKLFLLNVFLYDSILLFSMKLERCRIVLHRAPALISSSQHHLLNFTWFPCLSIQLQRKPLILLGMEKHLAHSMSQHCAYRQALILAHGWRLWLCVS